MTRAAMQQGRFTMRRSIGGKLDLTVLSALAGTVAPDTNRMAHFHALAREQQAEAIRRLAATGMSEHSMAHATGLAVEQIRRVLAEQAPDGARA